MEKRSKVLSYKERETGEAINYIGIKEFEMKYANDDPSIIGEISIKEQTQSGKIRKILNKEMYVYVQRVGTYRNRNYKTIGYLQCEDNEFIIVKKKSYTKWLIMLFIPLAMALLFFAGYMGMGDDSNIDPNADDYISQLKRPENIDDSRILVPGYGKFTIKKGSDTVDTVLFNPEDNPCYFQFTLVEAGTNKVLYESKLVPPGKGIQPVKLNKKMDKVGTYKAILKFQSIDLEDTDIQYNGSEMEVSLNVVE